MDSPLDVLDEERSQSLSESVREYLPDIPFQLRAYRTVSSTMDVAKELIRNQASQSGLLLILTDEQRAGRGRHNRKWVTSPGAVAMTAVLPTALEIHRFSGLSLAVGCLLAESLSAYNPRLQLKWPNDLLNSRGEKIGGVLIEFYQQSGVNYCLIGLGLNIEHSPTEVENAGVLVVSSGITTGKVIGAISEKLYRGFRIFEEFGFSYFREEWLSRAAYLSEQVIVHQTDGSPLSGVFEGIDNEGALVLLVNGRRERLHTVESLRPLG